MITVSHITKKFGSVSAVNDVSFTVREGEVVGLLGPNGAGKTTTMRIMTGYYMPDSGTVTLGDVSVTDDPVRARAQVGYLPESNPLYKDMLVSEYLGFVAQVREIPAGTRKAVFDRVVTDTGIDSVFYRPIAELSKGYRQRVGLAGTLVGDPSVLILDEPTEGLDPNQRNDMRALLARLAKDKTILVSTHVIAEIQAVAQRIIVLNNGTVAAEGTIDELTHGTTTVRYAVEIAGKGVEDALRALATVERIDIGPKEGARVCATVYVKDAERFPQELTKLLCTGDRVLYRLTQEQAGLERVFADLTRGADSAASHAPDVSLTR
jgi:ABC-2 type transport system ATP-binding protein